MRKLQIFLAAIVAILWVGCGDSGPVQKITYVNFDTNGNPQVYTLSSDGKTSTKINVTLPSGAFFIVASPDASKVAYCVTDTNNQTAIYTTDLKGKQTKLTSGANFGDCIPSFSRDGRLIVFESYRDNPNFVQMYIMNSDGSNQKRILTDTTDNFFPQLSPDNKSVAFFRYNSGAATKPAVSFQQQWQEMQGRGASRTFAKNSIRPATAISTGDGLYTVGIDGSNPKQVLSLTNSFASTAVFTSDGKKIVFATDQFAGDFEIAIVNLDGTGLKNLSNSPSTPDYAPLVIGSQILFNRDNSNGYSDIYEMNLDGTGQKNLTNTPTTDEYLPGYFGLLG